MPRLNRAGKMMDGIVMEQNVAQHRHQSNRWLAWKGKRCVVGNEHLESVVSVLLEGATIARAEGVD